MAINLPMDTLLEAGITMKMLPMMMGNFDTGSKKAKKQAKKARRVAQAQAEAFNNLAVAVNNLSETQKRQTEVLNKLENRVYRLERAQNGQGQGQKTS